ncbi:MAG TPA: MFS transporter [bacterium]|nr:MFS transporter [bacterium]
MKKSQRKKGHDPYASLRSRDFRLYIITNFLLIFGNQMVIVALGWELYMKTGQVLDLGLMGLFTFLPAIGLALLGGNVADRYDRRRILIVSTLAYLAGLAGLCWASSLHDESANFRWVVFGFLFLMGTCNAFYNPAKQAMIRQLVAPKDLTNAITWGSSAFQLASVTGPAACGFLLERVPYPYIYGTSIVFEVLFLFALMGFDLRKQARNRASINITSLMEGARFVWNTKPILATITMDLFAVLLGGCTALMPSFVKDILHSGPFSLGWLQAAPSIGAFLMALTIAQRPMKRPGLLLLWAVAGFGAATIVFGLSRNLWLSLAMMFLIGALDNISVIVRGSLVQVLTPDRLLGRVQAVNYLFINSSNQLGAFESGTVAALVGTVPSVVLGGIGSIAIVLGVAYLWPQVARLRSLQATR